MEDEIKQLKSQAVSSSPRSNQPPGKDKANPCNEYIHAFELRNGTTLPTNEPPSLNEDIEPKWREEELVDDEGYPCDPYSISLAREYAKENALKKEKQELEAKREQEEIKQEARRQRAKHAHEEAKKPRTDVQYFYLQEMDETVESPKDANEETLLELENLLNDSHHGLKGKSKEEVEKKSEEEEAPRVDFICSYSTQLVPPPQTKTKKKKAKGYGNDGTKAKEKQPMGKKPTALTPTSSSLTLQPWKFENGVIEYKVKHKGRSNPFGKVRAIVPSELMEKGQEEIDKLMSRAIMLKMEEPPWSAHTPHSSTK